MGIWRHVSSKRTAMMRSFRASTGTTKSLVTTLITTYGVLRGIHSGVAQSEVTMDDLFVL